MKVHFLPSNITAEVSEGTTVMQAIISAGLKIDAPCGSNGKCKKCKVKLTDASGTSVVLACETKITGDITVDLSGEDDGHRILMGGISRDITLDPAVKTVRVTVPEPSTADLRACWLRLRDSISEVTGTHSANYIPSIKAVSSLYKTLAANNFCVDAVLYKNTVLDVIPADDDVLAMAFDIGTTTIAAYFIDLRTGRELGQASMLNPQVKYGAPRSWSLRRNAARTRASAATAYIS